MQNLQGSFADISSLWTQGILACETVQPTEPGPDYFLWIFYHMLSSFERGVGVGVGEQKAAKS